MSLLGSLVLKGLPWPWLWPWLPNMPNILYESSEDPALSLFEGACLCWICYCIRPGLTLIMTFDGLTVDDAFLPLIPFLKAGAFALSLSFKNYSSWLLLVDTFSMMPPFYRSFLSSALLRFLISSDRVIFIYWSSLRFRRFLPSSWLPL